MASAPKTTRIWFFVPLDIDVNAWNEEYGTETVREVQHDVREYLMMALNGTEGGMEYITVVDG